MDAYAWAMRSSMQLIQQLLGAAGWPMLHYQQDTGMVILASKAPSCCQHTALSLQQRWRDLLSHMRKQVVHAFWLSTLQ